MSLGDVQPLDQAAVMLSGRQLVPDYAQQLLRERLAGVQEQEAQTNAGQEARLSAADQRGVQRQAGFQAAFDAWSQNPTMEGMSQLMAAYPEFHETARKAYEMRHQGERDTDRQQLGNIFGALANDRNDIAIAEIQRRRTADLAAGRDTSDEDALLEMLGSEDPEQHRRARSMVAYELANQMGEEHFAAGLDRLLETMERPDFEEYARSLNLEPGTDAYRDAMRDYALRGSGPTAHGYDVSIEGVRQDNRESLEGTRQGNRERLEGIRERNRRARPARPATPRQANTLERIRQKIAAGGQLTPGEQRLWNESRPGRRAAGRSGGGNGAIIRNPQTGQRMQLRNGQWVPVR